MGDPSGRNSEPDLRLDSWKEIAAYLGRTERTVRRWEQSEALPVHRLVHEKRGSIYAYRSELDAWLASRAPLAAREPDPAAAAPPDKRLTLWIAVALVAIAAALATAWAATWLTRSPAYSSIAVLPFENFSHDPAEEWFSDGMTEILITQLAKIRSLKVISRTSVMQYKGTRKSVKEIARELGVDAVVESSALRVGDRVRITSQLIAARNDAHLWADSYEAEMRDALSLQRDIADAVAREVGVRMSADGRAPLRAAPHSTNPDAMAAYLRGLYQYNQSALRPAVESAREAIRLDPNLAAAHILLGQALELWADYHGKTYAEIIPEARAALQRGLDLEPDNGAALSALGDISFAGEHDWVRGEDYLRRGYELDAGSGSVYAFLLAAQGKFDDAIRVVNRAVLADPANHVTLTDAARIHEFARRYDQALPLYRKALDVFPSAAYARGHAPAAFLIAGRKDEAFELFVWGGDSRGLLQIGDEFRKTYQTGGWPAVWQLYLDRVPATAFWPNDKRFAMLFLHRDQEALGMLEDLEKHGDSWLIQLEDPVYDHLRGQPRFKALLKRIGYPESMWR